MKILIVNGPNLNLLGKRNPTVYGEQSFENYFETLKDPVFDLVYFQSNVEGELIDILQKSSADGIILNAGGYTHTSVALRDTVEAISTPVVEVHLSNIAGRETFRHDSLISPVAVGCIFGFGLESYRLALNFFKVNYVK